VKSPAGFLIFASFMTPAAFINWHFDPALFYLGSFEIRWYGLLFGLSFLAGYMILLRITKLEKMKTDVLDKLTLYVAIGTFAGARLGHCFFYEPAKYLANPIEILYIRDGGLASHGAAIGIILSLWLFSRFVTKRSMLWALDRVVIVVAFSALFIRTGNLLNSEIIGNETSKPWGFVFQLPNAGDQLYPDFYAGTGENGNEIFISREFAGDRNNFLLQACCNDDSSVRTIRAFEFPAGKKEMMIVDSGANELPVEYLLADPADGRRHMIRLVARHPGQLYEAIVDFLIFLLLIWMYIRANGQVPEGRLFGTFLVLLFSARFLIEFTKMEQVGFEEGMFLNMGQLLSIPFVLTGLLMLYSSTRAKSAKFTSLISSAEEKP